MGPPLKAAENGNLLAVQDFSSVASMGPPLKAAENRRSVGVGFARRERFNGAAAKSSGKLMVAGCAAESS